jgi:hypothetical protein
MADSKKEVEEQLSFEGRELLDDVIYHLELYSEVMMNNRGGLSEKCVNHIGNALGNLYERLKTL